MDFSVAYINGIFIGITSGDAEADKFGDFIDAFLNHEKWKPGSPCVHDHSNLNTAPLKTEDVERMAGIRRDKDLFGSGKNAVVVSRDLEFGLVRMFVTFFEGKTEAVFKVFRSKEEALAWLSEREER